MKHKLSNLDIYIGVVKSVSDPAQRGRMKVLITNLDDEDTSIDSLPWVTYTSPVGGSIKNYTPPQTGKQIPGTTSYGQWNPPQLGANVLVAVANNDVAYRVFLGCLWMATENRALPGGVYSAQNTITTIEGNTIDPISTNYNQLASTSYAPEPDTNVAQAATNKDGSNGYGESAAAPGILEPQTYSYTTPGGHYLVMCDRADSSKVKLRTSQGSLLELNDSAGYMNFQTCNGNAYLTIDMKSGDLNIFANGNFSVHSAKDINFTADGNINMQSAKSFNAVAGTEMIINGESVDIGACGNLTMSGCNGVNISSGGAVQIYGTSVIPNKLTLQMFKAGSMTGSENMTNISIIGPVAEGAQGSVSGQGTQTMKSSNYSGSNISGTNSISKAEAKTAATPVIIPN